MTLSREDLTQRVQPWLEPISAATPSGSSARYEPDYERILVEVAKLEAPTGGAVDWVQVATLGKKLLGSKSKDMLVAAYTGYALLRAKKSLAGLLDGMVLVSELLDRFWDGLFPDGKRQKARAQRGGLVRPAGVALHRRRRPRAGGPRRGRGPASPPRSGSPRSAAPASPRAGRRSVR